MFSGTRTIEMPSLIVPESGLSFGRSQRPSSKPGSAVGLTLMDGVIEEMIKCFNNGKILQLSLGEHPILQYGTKTQHLCTSDDPFTQELFRASDSHLSPSSNSPSMAPKPLQPNPLKGVVKVENKPHPQFLAMFHTKKLVPAKKPTPPTNRSVAAINSKMAGSREGADEALAALQSSLASENAKKAENTTKYIKDGSGLPAPGRRGAPAKATSKSKFLSQNRSLTSDTTRSMPSSPALSGVGSPSLGPTSAPLSQQKAEQSKATRKPVVHLLALAPMSEPAVLSKIPEASDSDIRQALQKVGDLNESTGKWELRKNFYKELDVWSYDYDTAEDRQRAIDNAVKQYDKMRLGVSEPEWDRLLPRSERGTGKCLSKLQAQIAQGPIVRAPRTGASKSEDSGHDTPNGEHDDVSGDKNLSKVKSESLARSVSQPPSAKSKKVNEKEVQAKRLLSKNNTKPKQAPAKKERLGTKAGGKVLSSQFVSDSDEEEDAYLIPPKPAPKHMKRGRDVDQETSDSSLPLSKKAKKEDHSHRVSDASQSSRTTTVSAHTSHRTKGTSPQKSSPLASSPPTNASEFETSSSSTSPAHPNLKGSRSPSYKRHQKSSSVTSSASSSSQRSLDPKVTDWARRYRIYYPKYLQLHQEVEKSEIEGTRDVEREHELMDMHNRLSELKKKILIGIAEAGR